MRMISRLNRNCLRLQNSIASARRILSIAAPVLLKRGGVFLTMKSYDIAVIGGDGTGPEVTREALKVAEAAGARFGFRLNWRHYDFGGDRYLKTGEVLPDSAVEELRKFKAIFLGAVGHPQVKPGILEKGILLRLRFELEQYINLRPVKLYRAQDCPLKDKGPEHVDLPACTSSGFRPFHGWPPRRFCARSNAYLRQRSTPRRVFTLSWIATSCGVPLKR